MPSRSWEWRGLLPKRPAFPPQGPYFTASASAKPNLTAAPRFAWTEPPVLRKGYRKLASAESTLIMLPERSLFRSWQRDDASGAAATGGYDPPGLPWQSR